MRNMSERERKEREKRQSSDSLYRQPPETERESRHSEAEMLCTRERQERKSYPETRDRS